MICKICNNSYQNSTFHVHEMMFGFKDQFIYFQCSQCDCLQITEIPNNMSKYYPENYYSFRTPSYENINNPIKKLAIELRDYFAVFNKGIIGRLLYTVAPNAKLRTLLQVRPAINSSILDVGCGSGALLYSLKELGFTNLLGIDPYIESDIVFKNGLKIKKQSIHDLDSTWDLIMFHHSFEHIMSPIEVLQSVSKLLNKNGTCLISIPTVSSYAWEYYNIYWVQLDAPRHFFLHSVKSMEILAEKSNLEIEQIVYNSTDFQFWGSEQYLKGIPLSSDKSYSVNPSNSIFSPKKIKEFKLKAKQLNIENRGDSATFYLKKR